LVDGLSDTTSSINPKVAIRAAVPRSARNGPNPGTVVPAISVTAAMAMPPSSAVGR
jgi:hypothetical protein